MFFLRRSTLERLPVAMSGVRMGERALQIGIDDPSLAGAIAAKVGLSGHAALAVADGAREARARTAAAKAGALVDIHVTPLDALPFPDESFDVAVVHAAGVQPLLEGDAGVPMLRDVYRVLRSGGRVVIIEGGGRRGLLRGAPQFPAAGGILTMLTTAGFRTARVLAEREGHRFFEAVRI
jgi:ubiquinone/menaquinone biosynthesis C-methylase UbiE